MSNLNNEKTTAGIERLISLGYPREDIQVLPDGTLTIVPSDEMRSSAIAVARATAPERIKRMVAQKETLEQEFQSGTMPAEKLQRYLHLMNEIDRARALLPGN